MMALPFLPLEPLEAEVGRERGPPPLLAQSSRADRIASAERRCTLEAAGVAAS